MRKNKETLSREQELAAALDKAKKSKSYMVAIWSIEDNQLEFYRVCERFPLPWLEDALRLLSLEADRMRRDAVAAEHKRQLEGQ